MSTLLQSLLNQNQSLLQYIARAGGGIVDPGPDDWGWGGGRPAGPFPKPGDPAPFDLARARAYAGLGAHSYAPAQAYAPSQAYASTAELAGLQPIPVDPSPLGGGAYQPWWWKWHFVPNWRPQVDPAPFDTSRWQLLQDFDLVELTARMKGVAVNHVSLDDVKQVQFGDLVRILPGGGIVDPAPGDPGRGGFPFPYPYPFPFPFPHVPQPPLPFPRPDDPPPLDRARLDSLTRLDLLQAVGVLRGLDVAKLGLDSLRAIKVRDLIGDLRGPKTDPVPDPYFGSMLRLHPDALARMGTEELQATRHRLNAEMVRLKSLEGMVAQALEAGAKSPEKPDKPGKSGKQA